MAVDIIPQWPENILPYEPTRSTYSLVHQDDNARTVMDVGPRRVRRRFTDTTTHVGVEWHWTALEFEYFRAFYEDDLQSGSLWFDVNVFTGSEYQTKRVRFLQPFESKDRGYDHWIVRAQLEIRDLGTVGGGMVWLINEYGLTFVLDTLMAQTDDYVNTHYYDAVDPRYT